MSHPVTHHLNEIAQAAKSGDASKASAAIRAARAKIKEFVGAPGSGAQGRPSGAPLQILDSELSTWESKLNVILKEPAGRQGMARHVEHWVKRLE